MPRSALPLWLALAVAAHSSRLSHPEVDSSLAASWKEGTPLLSARSHRYHLVDFPQSCCLAPPPRALTLDARTGGVLATSPHSVNPSDKSIRKRFQAIRNEGGLRSLIPADDLKRLSTGTSREVRFGFSAQFSRFGASQGGAFETGPSPLDTFPLPGHCCDPGGSDTTPCRAAANRWTLWVDPATRRGLLRSGFQTQADACDVLDRFHVVDWGTVVDDSVRHLSNPAKVFEHGYAGWGMETRRIHVASWPNLGGGYPDQQHLVIDARTGGILQTRKARWLGSEEGDVQSDSVKKARRDLEALFFRSKVVPVRPWESVRRISAQSGPVLQGIQNGKCMRIQQTLPKRIQVSPSCCEPTAEQPTKPCLRPANDWVFWPAPLGQSGLLRAQTTSLSNDCTGGPVYSIESWSPATCSDEDFLDL